MKKFLKRSLLFILLTALSVEVISAVLIYTDLYLLGYPGRDVYHSIIKSKEKKKSRKVLLGDSVGQQLFPSNTNNDSINSLACNQAIGVIGQYLLLNNYLNAGNEIDTVFMIFTPFSFRNNLDQRFTFHYFLKPFATDEYEPLFTETVKQQIGKIPYHQFARVPHILATSWAPEFNPPEHHDFTFLSPVSAEYLQKIKNLANRHHFKLIILPTPTRENKKQQIEQIDLNEIDKYHLTAEFKDYFNKIIYLDTLNFIDETHLIHPELFTEVYRQKLMR